MALDVANIESGVTGAVYRAHTDATVPTDLGPLSADFQEFGDDADYETFRREVVLAPGQRVACDEAYVWNATRHLAEFNPAKWTWFLRRMGFIGVIDNGTSTIHPNEPTQVVFFDPPSLKLEEIIDNRVPQYEGHDRTRLNLAAWSRDRDETTISNELEFESVKIGSFIDGFIRNLRNGTKFVSNPMEHARDDLYDASRRAEIVFKYLGWVASHIKLLENKSFWQVEVQRTVTRVRDCLEKLEPFIGKVYSVKMELDNLYFLLKKIIRNFGNWS